MSRYRDFDAAFADLEPIRFKAAGHEYTLDEDPPCDVILRVLAEGRMNDPVASIEILESVVGAERLTKMRADGLGITQLAMLSEWLMEQMGFSAVGATALAVGAESGDSGNG